MASVTVAGPMIVRPFRGKAPKLGERVFVAENAALIGDVELADDVSIWYGTVLRGDIYPIRVGARSNIQDNCTLHVTGDTWPTILEEEVTLGHGVIAHGCTIKRGSLIGMRAVVLDGAEIGEYSIVAAGALVTEGMVVPPRSVVMGSPAKVKRSLNDDDLVWLSRFHTAYLGYKEEYLAQDLP